jgi:hypothetical protein
VTPSKTAARLRVVVDGSNLATEGRTAPSLVQLDEAVSAYVDENPRAEVIVVVDASFDHRIAPGERARFKEAELAGEVVTTPAGAVGRGDAFILKIASRIGAVVLSNDSFQEFHEEHPWLFDEGRLIGGKPVPGVGWIFAARLPVRGAKSVRTAKKLTVALPGGAKPHVGATITPPKVTKAVKVPRAAAKPVAKSTAKRVEKSADKSPAKAPRVAKKEAKAPEKAPAKTPKTLKAPRVAKKEAKAPEKAPAKATRPAKKVAISSTKPSTKVAGGVEPAVALRRGRQPVNPESEFKAFTTAHRPRSLVEGEVVAFTSHGAIIAVDVSGGRRIECYAPTTSLGTPAPVRARDVLKRGDRRKFRLVSVDKDRRIAELALP